jgi:hypothetical protein
MSDNGPIEWSRDFPESCLLSKWVSAFQLIF